MNLSHRGTRPHRRPPVLRVALASLITTVCAVLCTAILLPANAGAASFPSEVTLTHGGGGGDNSYGTSYGYSVNVRNTITYCAQASVNASPDGSTFSVREISDVLPKARAHQAKLVAYFGFGGAGFDASHFERHFGSSFTADGGEHDHYFGTHLLFSKAVSGTTGAMYASNWDDRCDAYLDLLEQRRKGLGINVDALEVYIFNESNPATQTHVAFVINQKAPDESGDLSLTKSGKTPAMTAGNPCYSLAGAVYTVYADKACTKVAGTITTKADGTATVLEGLSPQTYYVRETTAPKGYAADGETHAIEVEPGKTASLKVSDEPDGVTGALGIVKLDAVAGKPTAQGDASLKGAVFQVSHYGNTEGKTSGTPLRTWQFTTDSAGTIDLTDAGHRTDGDALYTNAKGKIVLPLGTYLVTELHAPTGYLPNATSHVGVVKQVDGSAHWSSKAWTDSDGAHAVDGRGVTETVMSGGVTVRKTDRELEASRAQGDATLAGAQFAIVNRSKTAVVVSGAKVEPGDTALVITANAQGVASTGTHDLPFGTYEIREVKAPEGYLADQDWKQTVEIREDGKRYDVQVPCANRVVRGGVRLGKVSSETGSYEQQGGASLEGATFSVINMSPAAVRCGDTMVEPGGVAATLVTESRDGRYVAQSKNDALPYGTYRVVESAVDRTHGYLLNEGWEKTFQIRRDGEVVDLSGEQDACPNELVRNDVHFVKRDASSGAALAGVPFLLTSDTTGEAHVLVCDENGRCDTQAAAHSANTNANDAALHEDGTVDETALSAEAGVWFSGSASTTVAPNDSLGALPFDTYTLTELPCSANEGLELVSIPLAMHYRTGYSLDWGTLDDRPGPTIATLALGTNGAHEVPVAAHMELVDTVTYLNLAPGTEYEMVGTLMDRTEGGELLDAKGEPVSSRTTFTPRGTEGTVELRFSFDTPEGLAGHPLVAFERCLSGGTEVATHADLESADQTVTPVSIATTLATSDGAKTAAAAEELTLIDTVAYEGLAPGSTYTVTGTLMDRESGEQLPGASTASTSFEARDASGTVEVSFTLDARELPGGTIVAFERLFDDDGHLVALHEDLNDEAQTVQVPRISTMAADKDTGDHQGLAQGTRTVVDHIAYEGLTAGAPYTMTGSLHVRAEDGSDAGELTDADGTPVRATKTFTPTQGSGTVDVAFKVNADQVAGKSVVAFERCEADGALLVAHEDIGFDGQTVSYPRIATTLTDERGARRATTETTTLVDTVTYENLQVGRTYTLTGTLMGAETGKPIEGATASETFSPETASGTQEVRFTVNLSKLAGTRVVAFERLSTEGEEGNEIEVALHEDLDDEDQSLTVSAPSIKTELVDAADHDHAIAATGTASLIDTVTYRNLTPGTTYVMSGSLHKRQNGKDAGVLKDGNTEVTGTTRFTPEAPDGTVEVEFRLSAEALGGADAVAFERCSVDGDKGTVVAEHADITDASQTVGVERPSTPSEPGKPSEPDEPSERLPQTGRAPYGLVALAVGALLIAGGLVQGTRARRGWHTTSPRHRHHF